MMKRRILAVLLAGTLILALAACGAGKNDSDRSDQQGSPVSGGPTTSDSPTTSGGPATPAVPQPETSPDVSLPDNGGVDISEPGSGAGSSAPDPAGTDITLTLNRTNIELNKAGATFQLRYTVDPDIYDGLAVFTSSDAKVAAVDESGTIKAVSPGKATITVKYDSVTTTASVNCNWDETPDGPVSNHPVVILPGNPPAPADKPSTPTDEPPTPADGPSTPAEEPPAPADDSPVSANVDLSAFYSSVIGKYDFPMPMLADDEILDNFYSGMTGIGTEQRLIYICGSSMNTGEFGLVQVKDGGDVETVKKIFQARIDAQASGGAWYPQAVENWANNSRIVSSGNYVMMVVHESCDDIVKEFHALF